MLLRRSVLVLVVAAGLFAGSVGIGYFLASAALRHSAGAGLTAALSVPRPAGQLGSPIVSAAPPSSGAVGPEDHTAGAVGNATVPLPPSPAAPAQPPLGISPSPALSTRPAVRPAPAPAATAVSPGATTAVPGPGAPAGGSPATPPPSGVTAVPQPAPAPGLSGGAPATPPATAPDTTLPPGATPLPPPPPPAPAVAPAVRVHVQVGSFDERQNADALAIRLRAGGYAASVTNGPPYRVWVGGYLDPVTAQRLADGLKNLGLTPELVTQ